MKCPECTGPMWDNRENKRNPKQPDYKCKDKNCDHAIWLNSKKSSAPEPKKEAESEKEPVNAKEEFRHALMRVLNAMWLIERGVTVESDQSKVNGFDTSEAHLQAKCSTAFIHLDRLGLVAHMPDKPLWSAVKTLSEAEIKKVFPAKEEMAGEEDF